MPVNPALAITIPASTPLYRITSISFHTPSSVHHKKVVNGMGARKSRSGAPYNYPGVLSVYLADTVETCLAEKMFYFHRETIRGLALLYLTLNPGVPLFSATYTLWEIRLKKAVTSVWVRGTPYTCAVNRVRCWSSVGANPTRQLGRSSR